MAPKTSRSKRLGVDREAVARAFSKDNEASNLDVLALLALSNMRRPVKRQLKNWPWDWANKETTQVGTMKFKMLLFIVIRDCDRVLIINHAEASQRRYCWYEGEWHDESK